MTFHILSKGHYADALIFFGRTLLVYIMLVAVIRIMGKREIGKLSPIDLVVTIMIADAAIIAVEKDKPLWIGVAPVAALVLAEMLFSWLSLKSVWLRNLLSGKPTLVIDKGQIQEKRMRSLRYNVDDLMTQLRQKNIYNVADVEYAILEPTGQLSVIPKAEKRPATPTDLGIKPPADGLVLTLVSDGQIAHETLKRIKRDEAWLLKQLKRYKIDDIKSVLLAAYDTETQKIYVQLYQGAAKSDSQASIDQGGMETSSNGSNNSSNNSGQN